MTQQNSNKTLRFIMGDQLTSTISALTDANPDKDCIMLCEVSVEATHVKHHKKKIALIFSAMRHFAKSLEKQGYQVFYSKLDDLDNTGSFPQEVSRIAQQQKISHIIFTEPSEYQVKEML